MHNLNNKVVIVTGAGKGIGYETAKVFYNYGAKIAVISRNGDDLSRLKDELGASEDSFYQMQGDVSEERSVNAFVDNVHKKFQGIDCLINNAGMRFRKKFLDISYSEWQSVMNVNLGSAMLMSKAVIPHMVKHGGGRIINMASIV